MELPAPFSQNTSSYSWLLSKLGSLYLPHGSSHFLAHLLSISLHKIFLRSLRWIINTSWWFLWLSQEKFHLLFGLPRYGYAWLHLAFYCRHFCMFFNFPYESLEGWTFCPQNIVSLAEYMLGTEDRQWCHQGEGLHSTAEPGKDAGGAALAL